MKTYRSINKKNRKAQSALEFIMLFSFIFIIFIGMFAVFNNKLVKMTQESEELQLEQIQKMIVTELQIAEGVMDGYQRQFSIPKLYLGREYFIELKKQDKVMTLVITGSGRERFRIIHLNKEKFFGAPIPGENYILKQDNILCISDQPMNSLSDCPDLPEICTVNSDCEAGKSCIEKVCV